MSYALLQVSCNWSSRPPLPCPSPRRLFSKLHDCPAPSLASTRSSATDLISPHRVSRQPSLLCAEPTSSLNHITPFAQASPLDQSTAWFVHLQAYANTPATTLVFAQHKSATMREFFGRFRPQADTIEMHNAESIISASDIRHVDHEKTKHHNRGATPNSIAQTTPTQGFDSDEEMIHRDAQAGVQKIEAITRVWSKKHMIAAYVM